MESSPETHLLASVVSEFVSSAGSGVWLIAHRRELVAQMEETLAKYGIRREDTPVRVMAVQWLSRHWNEAGDAPGLIVIDEAHHALAASYTEMWKRYPAAKKLGVTATPCRLNRRGFTELFEVLVTSWSIAEFIEKGVLSVFDYVSIRPGSEEQRLIDGLEKRGADGDYQEDSCYGTQADGGGVQTWKNRGAGECGCIQRGVRLSRCGVCTTGPSYFVTG